jgi:hypothetical protein
VPIRGLGAERPNAKVVSGQPDLCIRSLRDRHFVEPNDSILWGRL